MPRVARFRCAAIGDLLRQLQYAPLPTLRRQMEAAESLIGDIEPSGRYPADFVVFRITGYRPESAGPTLEGSDLIADLVTLVQRLSDRLALAWDDGGREALPLPSVAASLRVSTKSLQRYRRRGLVCHYVDFGERPPGGRRLACFRDALERYRGRHASALERAAAFSRVQDRDQQAIVEEARALRTGEGVSLNEAALRIARRHRRAHETVRCILERHDRRAAEPIFAPHGPLTARDLRLIHRAWQRGIPVAVLVRRFAKSPSTVRRALRRERAARLRKLALDYVSLSTFDLVDAEDVVLSARELSEGLAAPGWYPDALALLERSRARSGDGGGAVDDDAIAARLAGYNMLKRRAVEGLARLGRHPAPARLDRVETDLRWAGRLKRRIVADALPAAVHRIERNLGGDLVGLPTEHVTRLLDVARVVLIAEAETVDPSRGQRYVRRCELAIDRALAGAEERLGAGRASVRRAGRTVAMAELLRDLVPWEHALELRRDLEPHVGALAPALGAIVRARYGLDDAPPRTIAEITAAAGLPRGAAQRSLQQARVTLRALARGDGAGGASRTKEAGEGRRPE